MHAGLEGAEEAGGHHPLSEGMGSAAGETAAQGIIGSKEDASGLCLSSRRRAPGQLVQLSIPKLPPFEAVRTCEFAAWRAV
jgi:hypothetical protein